jgi:hypothetical protein
MKLRILLLFVLLTLGFINTSYADAICKDGWKSKSNGSGTCSWHGGVFEWLSKDGSSPSFLRDYYDSGNAPPKSRKGNEWKRDSGRLLVRPESFINNNK